MSWFTDSHRGAWKDRIVLNTDDGKVHVCVRGLAHIGMVIPFGGDVVLSCPKANCFYLRSMAGVDFYLQRTGYGSITSVCFQPAWAMKFNATKYNCEYDSEAVSIDVNRGSRNSRC